ncbi:4Fe-4S ferredoxin, iron-sulfur binding protein [Dehalobacter sp. UNSWDHB]|uniref:DUF362 domain-containing protein n=1 Tax=Dehalobacter sp. UNSWDHB TaxID=1339256 RepID=UPI0003877AB7|nr:4Fe-4S binding protein [Dehalobacter sp. UNSWDHB]EQB22716.1 4Fe-4S ferredoxin, iron-sulfur binding protein [Dehalobacter sp. UNSWDHB]
MSALVNRENCTGCGRCRDICPVGAITLENGKAVINDGCIECGACTTVCPKEAIGLHPLNTGSRMPEKDRTRPQGKGLMKKRGGSLRGQRRAAGTDPAGYCICSNCGEKCIHMAGIPCNLMNCPKCGTPMTRGF